MSRANSIRRLVLAISILVFFTSTSSLLADEVSGVNKNGKIVSINVVGNHVIEKETILDKVRTKVGQKVDRRRISRDVRRLFATGFFSDIQVTGILKKDGRHLTYHVKEHPVIASVSLDGLHAVKAKDVKLKLKLKSGRVFSKHDLDKDIRTIRKGYLKKGYYQLQIDPIQKVRADGRVDITLKVVEGDITRIKRIRFIGNASIPDNDLATAIASRQSGLMAWFKDRDVFNKDRLQADKQLILQHYMNNGYLDAKVESTLVSLSSDKRSFFITFSIHEGIQYEVNSIKLQGDIVPDKDTLMALVQIEEGELYSLEKMRNSIDEMTTRVGDEGYAFATVTPLLYRNIDEHTVDVTFDIEKGQQVYVERIEISGNNKTVDSLIRRQMRQQEGARFSSSKLEKSKMLLKRLSYFKDVRISMPKGSAPDKVHMNVNVDETRTGSFSIGAGFSQLQKVFVRSSIRENNFLGKGYVANLSGEIGARTQNFNTSVTDPFFMDENLSLSLNTFKRQTSLQSVISFKEDSFGGGVGVGIPITDYFSYGVNYQFTNTNLTDLPSTASLFLQSQAGKQTTGELTQSLTWDTRDSFITPKEGYLLRASLGVAGVGGINKFIQPSVSAGAFFPIGEDFTLNPSFSVSYIRGYAGRSVPIFRLFSMGGIGSVRGFDLFGITIRDPATGQVIGGNKKARASINLFFPLPYMKTSGFRGLTFVDAGSIADFNEPLKLATMRVSAGFGIEWLSPIGPVGLSWAIPLRTQPGDRLKTFEFALGSRF